MGSFTRIKTYYSEISEYIENINKKVNIEIIGTFLNSENVHRFDFPESGYIVLGNESNGISAEVEKFITKKITIPRFGNAESLNVGIATAVVLDNLKRRE
jgi:TrmH family RNA methyltransferase